MDKGLLRVALVAVIAFSLFACQNEFTETTEWEIPTPMLAKNSASAPVYYRGEVAARNHPCITHDPPIHDGFWRLAYASAKQAVGRVFAIPYVDENGNRIEGGYLNPENIEFIEIKNASFGELRWGRRTLSIFLQLWVSGWQKFPDGGDGGFVYHGAEGYMDEETCEITYFRSW